MLVDSTISSSTWLNNFVFNLTQWFRVWLDAIISCFTLLTVSWRPRCNLMWCNQCGTLLGSACHIACGTLSWHIQWHFMRHISWHITHFRGTLRVNTKLSLATYTVHDNLRDTAHGTLRGTLSWHITCRHIRTTSNSFAIGEFLACDLKLGPVGVASEYSCLDQ